MGPQGEAGRSLAFCCGQDSFQIEIRPIAGAGIQAVCVCAVCKASWPAAEQRPRQDLDGDQAVGGGRNVAPNVVSPAEGKAFDRVGYQRAYMREYMRERRAKAKEGRA